MSNGSAHSNIHVGAYAAAATARVLAHLSTKQLGRKPQESFSSASSDQLSDASVLDAGPDVPEISADEFLLDFLPKVPNAEGVVGDVVSWIKDNPKHYANGRWKSFRQDPVAYKQTEPKVFARMYDIYNAIIDAVEHCMPDLEQQRTTEYVQKPAQPPATVFRRDLACPDACFLFRDRQSRDKEMPHWMDIALIGEYKKKNTERAVRRVSRLHCYSAAVLIAGHRQNIKHILTRMCGIMREDPRRRFAYGYTIENRDFRMWIATRSGIVVSGHVDFLTVGLSSSQCKAMVHLLLGARLYHSVLLCVHVWLQGRVGLRYVDEADLEWRR